MHIMGMGLLSLIASAVIAQPSILPIDFTRYEFLVSGQNISEEYRQESKNFSNEKSEVLSQELKSYKILLVPGFFSNNVQAWSQNPIAQYFKWGEQFGDYIDWYIKNGIEHEIVTIESEAEPSFNAKLIQAAILQSDRPVILIAHSKGCIDSLETFFSYPETLDHIKAFLPLNGPFQGTPLANASIQTPQLQATVDWILRKMGGSIKSVESLRVEDRQNFLKEWADQIQQLIKNKPMISVAARIPRSLQKSNTNFQISRNFLESHGYINDGLLPWQSSILPGSEYIIFDDMDHATSIRYSKFVEFDRSHFMQTMLWMLRKRLPEQKF